MTKHQKIIKEVTSFRQLAEMMLEKATALEKELGLVSAPTARKGKGQQLAIKAVAKRRSFLLKTT